MHTVSASSGEVIEMIEVQGARGELVLRLAGNFDAAAAERVCGRIREVPRGAGVVIDFSAVRHVDDRGLAVVAGAIGDHGAGVAVRGLGRHHERILRYFGVELQRAAREADAR